MRTKIILVSACAVLAPLAFGQIVKAAKPANKANPLETPAATPMAAIQTVTSFKVGEAAIEVESTPQTRPVKYLLSKKVHYVDATGKAIDPHKIQPGTQVRLESKTKGRHGVYRRVVVLLPQ